MHPSQYPFVFFIVLGYCGFENGQCGFTQAPTDALPWQLSRAFPASEFLPPFDATYKTPLGTK